MRLGELAAAVKLVYASTFSKNAKAYVANTPHRPEEEKMAVVVQEIVGRPHGRYFYPSFAGVACSRNYYPVLGLKAEEGLAAVALGFGRTVVEGGEKRWLLARFAAQRPAIRLNRRVLDSAQREFYALDLEHASTLREPGHADALVALSLETAERDGTFTKLAPYTRRTTTRCTTGCRGRGFAS